MTSLSFGTQFQLGFSHTREYSFHLNPHTRCTSTRSKKCLMPACNSRELAKTLEDLARMAEYSLMQFYVEVFGRFNSIS